MKKIALVLIIICMALTVGCINSDGEFLRIHIRANSNSSIDQRVKYQVKDEIVDALIPLLAYAETKEESEEIIKANFVLIESVADKVLRENGFNYTSKAKLSYEEFPTRSYDGLTLEKGFYDALVLELGTGTGDNWWCVVYPPLCFTQGSSENIVYKSKIWEIIQKVLN